MLSLGRTIQTPPPQKVVQEWLKEQYRELNVPTWPLNSSDSNSIEHPWNVPEQVWFMEAPPCNQQDSKNALPTPWCQTLRDTPRDPVSMPPLLKALSNPRWTSVDWTCSNISPRFSIRLTSGEFGDQVDVMRSSFMFLQPFLKSFSNVLGAHCPVGRRALPLVLSPAKSHWLMETHIDGDIAFGTHFQCTFHPADA